MINNKFLSATIIIGGLSAAAPASLAADSFGSATATISRILTVAETSSLDFGTIAISPLSGVVTLSAAGTASTTIPAAQVTGSIAAAQFLVSGDPNAIVSISFSSGDTLTGPGSAMSLQDFSHDAGSTPTIGPDGNLVFRVGASLAVNANQSTGAYAGQYTVTINYN